MTRIISFCYVRKIEFYHLTVYCSMFPCLGNPVSESFEVSVGGGGVNGDANYIG